MCVFLLQGPLLDFFGVPVKADELLSRVEELQLLAKRISRYEDPISQFRALAYLKPATWSKGCGWNQSKLKSVFIVQLLFFSVPSPFYFVNFSVVVLTPLFGRG